MPIWVVPSFSQKRELGQMQFFDTLICIRKHRGLLGRKVKLDVQLICVGFSSEILCNWIGFQHLTSGRLGALPEIPIP